MRLGGYPPAGSWSPGTGPEAAAVWVTTAKGFHRPRAGRCRGGGHVARRAARARRRSRVRARNDQSDRVTLVLADSTLRELIGRPLGPGRPLRRYRQRARVGRSRAALVLTPKTRSSRCLRRAYVEAIGEELRKYPWVRTQTMSDLLAITSSRFPVRCFSQQGDRTPQPGTSPRRSSRR